MSQTITDFISNFRGGFRPNRFRVIGSIGGTQTTTEFHILTASLPESKISTIEIPYRGRSFKMPGNREYGAWDIVVLDDVDGTGKKLWDDFHSWSEKFNDHVTNKTSLSSNFGAVTTSNANNNQNRNNQGQNSPGTNNSGMNHWTVKQLDIDGNPEKTIQLYNCWPSKVGPILLSMDKNDELVTFSVSLQYQYMKVDDLT